MRLHNHGCPSLNATGLGNANNIYGNGSDLKVSADMFFIISKKAIFLCDINDVLRTFKILAHANKCIFINFIM